MLALLLAGLSWPAFAREMTAYQLVKEADRYVGEDVKDQVVELRSEKSIGGLVPNIWFVTFYDPDATFKATEIKFGAGKKLEVKRPARVLEWNTKDSQKLDPKKLNVDSDKAISIATKEPVLKGLNLKATQLWLEHSSDGPVWKVRIWAAKLRNPNDDANLGEVYVKADDGTVTKDDLHIDRVD
ncbi:MAG TPA: hypothetical protein VG754_03530 [Verrucomicrobiae bacterium]|jgi:hypothetical protein|nr:hypothetical protein [Verrucomicrobiae bacterium]